MGGHSFRPSPERLEPVPDARDKSMSTGSLGEVVCCKLTVHRGKISADLQGLMISLV